MKAKPAPLRYDAPCAACAGPHRLVDCDDLRGADLLAAADLPMTARKVRVRAEAKGGAA